MTNVIDITSRRTKKDPADRDSDLREARAAALACGQSLGPRGQGVDDDECSRIEARAAEIAAAETCALPKCPHTMDVYFGNCPECGAWTGG